MPTTLGIDVSHYQGTVDWASVKSDRQGIAFAFAKATEGTGTTDATFAANWTAIKSAGLIRGAYHFFHPSEDPAQQANFFLSVASFVPGDLPPVLDLEASDNCSAATIQSGVSTWLQVVTEKTGINPLIYCSASFWNTYFNGQFGSNPLWVANYGVSSPKLPNSWKNWNFWQYSQSGSVQGISGYVDLDYFNGSPAQLAAFSQSPAAAAQISSPSPAPAQTYTVQTGDTLSEIAAKFNVSVDALASANGIQNVNLIQVGQVLQIPAS